MPETARLSIRPAVAGDAALYCDLFSDPDTMRFVGPPLSQEQAADAFRKVLASLERRPVERVLLVIVEKATGQSIGIGAFQDFDPRLRRVDQGMMIGAGGRGRGFGMEASRALIEFAFATFEVDEVRIQHAVDNREARRIPIGLGMSHNTDTKSGKLVWSAWRHAWPAAPTSSG
jgi:[ribosomal protein S5]-alanine N-acetyltransferase